MEALDEQTRRAFVRVRAQGCFGTGVIVSPVDILTAAHVAKGDPKELRLHGAGWFGDVRPADVTLAKGELDAALIHVDPHGGRLQKCLAIADPDKPIVNIGDEVTIAGFGTSDRDIEIERTRIVSLDGVARAWKIGRAVPEGFSGGPALSDGVIAGLVVARQFSQGSSFFIGHDRIAPFVRDNARGELPSDDSDKSILRRFPLGPAVSHEIIDLLFGLDRVFAQLYSGREQQEIGRANNARRACGPNSGEKGLLDLLSLPDPRTDRVHFWWQVFVQAGLKSPRMLAAVLMLPDDAELGKRADERQGLLNELAKWAERNN